jgi:hypothetical protein
MSASPKPQVPNPKSQAPNPKKMATETSVVLGRGFGIWDFGIWGLGFGTCPQADRRRRYSLIFRERVLR